MIHLGYILQGTSSFSAKGQIEEDPANTEGVKIKRLTSIENSFESSIRSNILFLHMTLLKELQAFCPSPISPRCRLGSEVVEQRQGPGVTGCSRGQGAPSASPLQGSQPAGKRERYWGALGPRDLLTPQSSSWNALAQADGHSSWAAPRPPRQGPAHLMSTPDTAEG